MARVLPDVGDLVGFDHAVAGHDGTLSDASGELFIKPCTATEIAFYEQTSRLHPALADLLPTFLGTLELTASQSASLEEASAELLNKYSVPDDAHHVQLHHKVIKTKKIATNRAVVLANAAHGFKRPNILDVKLGVRLWADDAAAEKKARFDKITAETTHRQLGFRVAGMRVWQGHDAPRGGHVDRHGFKIYDKNYGRDELNTTNVSEAFRRFIFTETAGIDEELGRLVAQAFAAEVVEVQRALEAVETRMFSASLLFVFEGDGEALREAMEEASKPLLEGDGKGDGADAEEESDDDDDDDEIPPKIYAVKLIDFAHAEFVPGQGPDENSLTGIRSVAKILRELGGEGA